jgi:hypothetical protein
MCGENVLTPFPSLFLQSGLLSKKPSEFFHGYSTYQNKHVCREKEIPGVQSFDWNDAVWKNRNKIF